MKRECVLLSPHLIRDKPPEISATTLLISVGAPKLVQIRSLSAKPWTSWIAVGLCMYVARDRNEWERMTASHEKSLSEIDLPSSGWQLSALWVTEGWDDHHILRKCSYHTHMLFDLTAGDVARNEEMLDECRHLDVRSTNSGSWQFKYCR